jgi:hypothetical protein
MTRVDLYALPHKAIRIAINRAATAISATDPDRLDGDLDLVALALADLRAHAAHEEEFIHPLLERVAPEVRRALDAQHADMEIDLEAIDEHLSALRRGATPDRLRLLHRTLQRFNARNLLHLDEEETVAMSALWAAVPDDELAALRARFLAAHPEAMGIYGRWPDALSAADRQVVGVA